MNFKTTILIYLVLLLIPAKHLAAQVYSTEIGKSVFITSAPAKTIRGESNHTFLQLNGDIGSVALTVEAKSFSFSNNFFNDTLNDLLKKRFNDFYLESSIYPIISYEGTITNNAEISYGKEGSYPIYTRGKVKIHGIEREVISEGMVVIAKGNLKISSKIKIRPFDFKIRIPPYIGDMYFEYVEIEVAADMKTY